MKWHIVLTALALVQRSSARAFREAETAPGKTWKTLDIENADLTKRNQHLEAMMQVARNEVHRMDQAAKSKNLRHDHGGSDAEEIERLNLQLDKAKAQRKSLANTLRQMLAKNSTQIFRAQAEKAVSDEHALEKRYAKEHEAFEARIKEANGKYDETKEMVQTLQDQNMDLQRSIHDLRDKFAKSEKKDKDLATDKANLVETMRSLMRDTAKAKKELLVETEKEQKEAKELTAVKAKLANITKHKKIPKASSLKNGRKSAKNATSLNMKHEESMASKIAKMKDINRYIDRANVDMPSDDVDDAPAQVAVASKAVPKANDWLSVTKQVDSLQKQEDVIAKTRVANHVSDAPQDVEKAAVVTQQSPGLSNWLGLKVKTAAIPKDADGLSPVDALDPEAVKQEKNVEAKKAKEDADDGGDGIENLLSQAKDQLSAMDTADGQNSA